MLGELLDEKKEELNGNNGIVQVSRFEYDLFFFSSQINIK